MRTENDTRATQQKHQTQNMRLHSVDVEKIQISVELNIRSDHMKCFEKTLGLICRRLIFIMDEMKAKCKFAFQKVILGYH